MIKLLIMDVDGTLTDGKLYFGDNGEAFKVFHVRDGYGIKQMLPKHGIIPVVMTGRTSKIVAVRCRELGIKHCYQGCENKQEKLDELCRLLGLRSDDRSVYGEAAYIGDDLNDLECMKRCGLNGCPKDAVEEVKEIAQFVCARKGGDGAVREFIEWICRGEEAGCE